MRYTERGRLAMNTGLDQLVQKKIDAFSQFILEKEFDANSKSEIYAINCLKRTLASAKAYLGAALNDKQIIELNDHLSALDAKVRSLASTKLLVNDFKINLISLLESIESHTPLNQDALADKLLKDIVVLEKSEFGANYDHLICDLMYKNDVPFLNPAKRAHTAPIKFTSKMLPGFAKTEEEYDKIFKQYKGCVDLMPIEKLRSLIEDLNINLPSNSLILPQKEYVPNQVLMDLPRLSMLIINGKSLLEADLKKDKEALFCACMEAMEEDVDITLAALKLVTQATLARPTYILYMGFQYPETMTRVSHALDVVVSIKTLKNLVEIRMWAYFGIIRGESNEPFAYIGVMRKLPCPRELLMSGGGKVVGEAMDVYSPLYPRLKDLKGCDFDTMGAELKQKKVVLMT